MESTTSNQFDIDKLKKELQVARSEINNLRDQIRVLKLTSKRDIDSVLTKLKAWKCEGCKTSKEESSCEDSVIFTTVGLSDVVNKEDTSVVLNTIGTMSTEFPCKKGVPRQPGLVPSCKGSLTISNSVFTNPHHSLDGLNAFSHMWIIYYFDRNEVKHVHAKVSPPRLNGAKTGVFATRSPHRPCPIGLSLVQIDHIEGSTVYFSGVDMVDGTPVLDIKPYIPQYDDPTGSVEVFDGGSLSACDSVSLFAFPVCSPGCREAPDGQESDLEEVAAPHPTPLSQGVRVAGWVRPKSNQLRVNLSAEAERSLALMEKMDVWPIIEGVLREDPRSVYLKQRYINQFYTFLISDLHVSCKFNDNEKSVSVYKVGDASRMCDCEQQEWRCQKHCNSIND
ncbi:tRNA (adenine(37)-N6)-methyltransferase [Rhodnius prolixus]